MKKSVYLIIVSIVFLLLNCTTPTEPNAEASSANSEFEYLEVAFNDNMSESEIVSFLKDEGYNDFKIAKESFVELEVSESEAFTHLSKLINVENIQNVTVTIGVLPDKLK